MMGYLKGKFFNKKALATYKSLKNKENRGGVLPTLKYHRSLFFIAHVWDKPIRVFFYV